MSFKEKFKKFTSPTMSRKHSSEASKMVDSGVGFDSDSCPQSENLPHWGPICVNICGCAREDKRMKGGNILYVVQSLFLLANPCHHVPKKDWIPSG